ncbi:hypothetical protein PSAB6_60100 [Paraburkholderia sabiae]|nr:hypothetical protein PSAB6_60100 [Paraburkholderia sabiae]
MVFVSHFGLNISGDLIATSRRSLYSWAFSLASHMSPVQLAYLVHKSPRVSRRPHLQWRPHEYETHRRAARGVLRIVCDACPGWRL